MDIDMTALKAVVVDKGLSLQTVVISIEQALLAAYHHTEGHQQLARVELDRKTGHVTVWAAELDEDGEKVGEFDDTPADFGRIAATVAKQVLMQRLREATDDVTFEEFAAREGDLVSGVIQQGNDPRLVYVNLGSVEGVIPPAEQVPSESYGHGERIRCYVVSVRRGMPRVRRSPCRARTRTSSGGCSRWSPRRSPMASWTIAALAREAGLPHQDRRPRSGSSQVNAQGCVHRSDGPAGASRHLRTAGGEDRHRRLSTRTRPAFIAAALSPARVQAVEVVDETCDARPG
jgi:N utilization substance protein A